MEPLKGRHAGTAFPIGMMFGFGFSLGIIAQNWFASASVVPR